MSDIIEFTRQLKTKLRAMGDKLPIGTTVRVMGAVNANIGPTTTVKDLLAMSEQEWLRTPNLGKISAGHLMSVLHPPLNIAEYAAIADLTTERLIDELQRRGYAVQLTRPPNGHDP
jgi:DNA-directed RNA polymerase alpha subunit